MVPIYVALSYMALMLEEILTRIPTLILVDISDLELKAYSQKLSYMTYDFNLDNDLDIKPIAKSEEHFRKWVANYPFYSNVRNEGVILYDAA